MAAVVPDIAIDKCLILLGHSGQTKRGHVSRCFFKG